jgi:hypothetical protein
MQDYESSISCSEFSDFSSMSDGEFSCVLQMIDEKLQGSINEIEKNYKIISGEENVLSGEGDASISNDEKSSCDLRLNDSVVCVMNLEKSVQENRKHDN